MTITQKQINEYIRDSKASIINKNTNKVINIITETKNNCRFSNIEGVKNWYHIIDDLSKKYNGVGQFMIFDLMSNLELATGWKLSFKKDEDTKGAE